MLSSGNYPRRQAAQELVGAVDDDIGARRDEAGEVIFGCGIDDQRDVSAGGGLSESRKRDLTFLLAMMRDDIERRRDRIVKSCGEFLSSRLLLPIDHDDSRTRKSDRLLDRRAIIDEVSRAE